MPIGVLDSGVGGISVLKEIRRSLPTEDLLFFGDSQNAPYGDRTIEEIRTLTENAVLYLLKRQVKAIVVACNTATSAAGAYLRAKYAFLPIVAIEPALKPAVVENPAAQIVVIATKATIRGEKFQKLLAKYQEQATILPVALPGLVEFIERGELEGEALRNFLASRLAPYQNAKAIVLGCTHYPFVRGVLSDILPAKVYNGAEGTSKELRRQLALRDLLNNAGGRVELENSKDDAKLLELMRYLLEV